MNITKHFKILTIYIKTWIMISLQYRINFLFSFLGTSLWLISELLFFYFLFARYNVIAGWTYEQIIVLIGVNQMWIGSIYFPMIWPSLVRFSEQIRKGGIDKLLTLPISARFHVSIQKFDWTGITVFF